MHAKLPRRGKLHRRHRQTTPQVEVSSSDEEGEASDDFKAKLGDEKQEDGLRLESMPVEHSTEEDKAPADFKAKPGDDKQEDGLRLVVEHSTMYGGAEIAQIAERSNAAKHIELGVAPKKVLIETAASSSEHHPYVDTETASAAPSSEHHVYVNTEAASVASSEHDYAKRESHAGDEKNLESRESELVYVEWQPTQRYIPKVVSGRVTLKCWSFGWMRPPFSSCELAKEYHNVFEREYGIHANDSLMINCLSIDNLDEQNCHMERILSSWTLQYVRRLSEMSRHGLCIV